MMLYGFMSQANLKYIFIKLHLVKMRPWIWKKVWSGVYEVLEEGKGMWVL